MADKENMTLPNLKTWHSVMKGFNPTIKFMWDLDEQPPNSQYETQGHPDGHGFRYFVVADQDDDNLYYYLPESQQVREKVEQIPNQQWVKLNATGGKDEPADIDPVAVEVNESQTSQGGSQGGSSDKKYGPDDILTQMKLTIKLAREAFPDIALDDEGNFTEMGLKLAQGMRISWDRTNRRAPLYPGQGEEDEAEPEPEPEPESEETGPEPIGGSELPF